MNQFKLFLQKVRQSQQPYQRVVTNNKTSWFLKYLPKDSILFFFTFDYHMIILKKQNGEIWTDIAKFCTKLVSLQLHSAG